MTSDLEQEHTGLLQAQFQRASCHLALHTGCHRACVFLVVILSLQLRRKNVRLADSVRPMATLHGQAEGAASVSPQVPSTSNLSL